MEILCEIRNHVAFITLNRPAALNALSFGMIETLTLRLKGFIADPSVHAVLIQGAGEKAFCAGGDIRALYESHVNGSKLQLDFFASEYPLDYLLRFYPKPYVALVNGITMGGGMGIAQGSKLRIASDRTRMAMPECAIGFFPDVGASYFLSRLPGELGRYLALSGAQIRAADTLYCGLADFYLPPANIEALFRGLEALSWPDEMHAREMAVGDLVQSLAASPGPAPLKAVRAAIDRHFAAEAVPDILASLRSESEPPYQSWAEETAKLMSARSPTMLKVAHEQLNRGRTLGFADCLRMEIGMAHQSFMQGDFVEGIRALVIDKDNAPKWRPARLEDVSAAAVADIFKNPWEGSAHPLSNLEGVIPHAAQ
ncbi:MAG TPA: enoyl-CoA hydratase/isomerase family protein [Steroidobacteraceae bacterium]|jgi:enoyl-CoA hydratase/carnithine racemase